MFSRLKSDVQCILERDPAARTFWEVLTCYPGVHAVLLHRLAHACWTHDFKWLGRFISHLARFLTGIEIHPGAKIGERVCFDHALGVVVGAGAQVLGGFTVGDGAKVGSNAVVTKPVPAGATAVGNPARIIQAELDVKREEVASKMGFSAYGVTQSDDPLSQAMRGLIDNAATQEHQIAMLWQALEKLTGQRNANTVVPGDAALHEHFEADKLNQLLGK
jgi:serine O-acetyltransferase